jgi:hypothetical protein
MDSTRELYFVKADLYGVPRGVVERFHTSKGEALVASGELERYDADNPTHRAAAERAGYAVPKQFETARRK